MGNSLKKFQGLLTKELMFNKVDILQAVAFEENEDSPVEIYLVQFIDDDQEDEQLDAIADSQDPTSMRKAYQVKPDYMYAKLQFIKASNRWTVDLLDEDQIKDIKMKNQKLIKMK